MSDVPRIAFFDARPYDTAAFTEINKQFGFDIKYMGYRLGEDTATHTAGFDVVCPFVNDDLSKTTIDLLVESGVRLIALRSAGYNHVDLKAAHGRVPVVRVPAYSPHAVAEHAVALMLALNRKTHRAYYRTRDGNFNINGLTGFDMHHRTAGVIGTGRIGMTTIEILRGFGMRVLGYDRYPNQESAARLGFEYAQLEEIYGQADIITLHCPLTPETRHMIDWPALAKMKENVMIVNTSRGGLINTRDLIEALKRGKIGSAGLDVYEEEGDYFFEDLSGTIISDDVLARLLGFPNVLVTSHQAFLTREALANIAETTLENIKAFWAGETLQNEVVWSQAANG